VKKEKILEKLVRHKTEKLYIRLTRKFGSVERISKGFIIDKSDDFILLQESDEFRVLGYQIIPIKTIRHVRYNNYDKTYERILREEGLLNEFKPKYKINLKNWNTICNDIKKTGLTIISECEHPKYQYFCIGALKSVNEKSISIRYFGADGKLDKENTEHSYKKITTLSFDDHYANVFSKYTTE
jgi:hypothetical protein